MVIAPQATKSLHRVVHWYFRKVYGRFQDGSVLPHFCDPARVGSFAVRPDDLAKGHAPTLFRLFIGMAMFQARPDIRIMAQQLSMPRSESAMLASATKLSRLVASNPCPCLKSADTFDRECSVRKLGTGADCTLLPGRTCHVKASTTSLRRTGDMGKLPTSALLHLWSELRTGRLLRSAIALETDPTRRASRLVERFTAVYRVGEKLATMYVSALSTPALSSRTAPWFPAVDGSRLVVVDTNVANAIDKLRSSAQPATYSARANWLSEAARSINLHRMNKTVPSYSPRLVQQALYIFCSKLNRRARGETCQRLACPAPTLCPFCSVGGQVHRGVTRVNGA